MRLGHQIRRLGGAEGSQLGLVVLQMLVAEAGDVHARVAHAEQRGHVVGIEAVRVERLEVVVLEGNGDGVGGAGQSQCGPQVGARVTRGLVRALTEAAVVVRHVDEVGPVVVGGGSHECGCRPRP